jgi:hypothetical protein
MPLRCQGSAVGRSLDRAKSDHQVCTCSAEVKYMLKRPRFTTVLNAECRCWMNFFNLYLANCPPIVEALRL